MKLVILRVSVADAQAFENLPKPAPKSGEFIVRRVVLLDQLRQELDGDLYLCLMLHMNVYTPSSLLRKGQFLSLIELSLTDPPLQGFVVDARLYHLAIGYDTAQRLSRGEML